MKNLYKKLTMAVVGIASILFLSFNALGVDASFTVTGATITNLVSVGCRVLSFNIVNNGNAANNFAVIDGRTTNGMSAALVGTGTTMLGYSNGPYMGITQYATNIQKFETNYYGWITTNITLTNMLATVTNVTAPSTNLYRVMFAGSVGAGPGAILSITNNFACTFGLTITNSGVGTNVYNVTYSPNF